MHELVIPFYSVALIMVFSDSQDPSFSVIHYIPPKSIEGILLLGRTSRLGERERGEIYLYIYTHVWVYTIMTIMLDLIVCAKKIMLMMDPWHTEAQKRSTKTISYGNPIVHLLMKSLFSIQSWGYSPIEIGVADFPRVLYSTCSPVCFVWPEIFICARFRYYIFSEFLWHLETYRKLLVSGLWLIRSSGKSCLLVAIKLTSWFTTYFGKPKSSCLWPKITSFL